MLCLYTWKHMCMHIHAFPRNNLLSYITTMIKIRKFNIETRWLSTHGPYSKFTNFSSLLSQNVSLSKIWSRISNLHWLSYPSSLWWYRTALVSLCPSRHWYFWRVQAIFVERSRILICLMFPHDKYRPCTFFVRKVTFIDHLVQELPDRFLYYKDIIFPFSTS